MMMQMTLVIWVLVQVAKAIPMKNLNMMYIRKWVSKKYGYHMVTWLLQLQKQFEIRNSVYGLNEPILCSALYPYNKI